MEYESLAVICGLGAAAIFGAGDFCGGLATKRSSVYSVIIISQIIGLAMLAGFAVATNEAIPPAGDLAFGGLAGLFGTIGLICLYLGLARGQMGVAAPVSAVTGAILPVAMGIFMEGMPSAWQICGLLLGICAIWCLAGGGSGSPLRLRGLGLPIIAGLGFGMFFVFIDRVSETSTFWPLVTARVVSITTISTFATLFRQEVKVAWDRRLFVIALAGIFDAGGNILFAITSSIGRLDISAVLTSLYPAGTVFLAWLILKERLSPGQWAGVAVALAAVILIAL